MADFFSRPKWTPPLNDFRLNPSVPNLPSSTKAALPTVPVLIIFARHFPSCTIMGRMKSDVWRNVKKDGHSFVCKTCGVSVPNNATRIKKHLDTNCRTFTPVRSVNSQGDSSVPSTPSTSSTHSTSSPPVIFTKRQRNLR